MACFKASRKHHILRNESFYYALSISHFSNTNGKRYEAKRYRHRYIKYFENLDNPQNVNNRNNKLSLNEYGEYTTRFGDWLHNANETVHIRDRRIWEQEFRKLRKKYRQEYNEKFRQRLAEFTRIADAKMYKKSLEDAQLRERKRLSNIRINSLKAANNATKARLKMEFKRKNDIINYDINDQKRDIIREMIWEKPHKNWIIKENFNEKLNLNLIDECLDNLDNDYIDTQYPGLPKPGYYDTMEGLLRHSDKYFIDYSQNIKEEEMFTSITQQPISWYIRKNDSKDEYVEEIFESQLKKNKHLKRSTLNNQKNNGIDSTINQQQDIEYEVDSKNIVPNYWLNIDWDKQFENRNLYKNNLDKSSIFIGNKFIKKQFNDKYEDYKFMFNPNYHKLLKNVETMDKNQIIKSLKSIYGDLIPKMDENDNNNNNDNNIDNMINNILNEFNDKQFVKEMENKQWNLYKEFNDKMKHFNGIYWKSGKINFDSGIRQWRNDFIKWRYLIFADNKEHIEWRQRLRNQNLTENDLNLCKKAIIRLQQLEHLILARRTGANILTNLINDLEDDVLKVFYIWFEELTEFGEEICMGKGWSFNRYQQEDMLPYRKAKQIPIEYFN